MTRAEWVIKVLTESAQQELPRVYRLWLYENVLPKNIRVCIEQCLCNELEWTDKYNHEGLIYIQDDKQTFEKDDIDISKQALLLLPYFFETSNPYYLVFWYNPETTKCENIPERKTGAMKLKKFNFPIFEEWQQKDNRVSVVLGAYRVEIRPICWGDDGTLYGFAVSLADRNPHNIYTEQLFCDRFRYKGNVKSLKQWYEDTIEAFQDFWENHIKSTYFEDDEVN